MARQRLGVVLLVPQPMASQIDGLRRALGDDGLGRIEPHITLVPPVNVNERDLPQAFTVVRAAAATVAPLTLRLGPVDTFVPVNPVAYLRVGGDAAVLADLDRLRLACLQGPLERRTDHDFVPHVTVADVLTEGRLGVVGDVLAGFAIDVTIDRVHVLAEQPGRLWRSVAEAPLGEGPSVVGRGSLPLELVITGRPDAEAAALLALDESPVGLPFAVTAYRDGHTVAATWGWSARGALEVADLVVSPEHRGQGIGRHLLAAVEALARRRGCSRVGTNAPGGGASAALLAAAGFQVRPSEGQLVGVRRWEHTLAAGASEEPG
jgi:2'-5' RNA ligase/GNAT superfamily N-acetyltransferase